MVKKDEVISKTISSKAIKIFAKFQNFIKLNKSF